MGIAGGGAVHRERVKSRGMRGRAAERDRSRVQVFLAYFAMPVKSRNGHRKLKKHKKTIHKFPPIYTDWKAEEGGGIGRR